LQPALTTELECFWQQILGTSPDSSIEDVFASILQSGSSLEQSNVQYGCVSIQVLLSLSLLFETGK